MDCSRKSLIIPKNREEKLEFLMILDHTNFQPFQQKWVQTESQTGRVSDWHAHKKKQISNSCVIYTRT